MKKFFLCFSMLLLLLVVALILASCSKDEKTEDEFGFERSENVWMTECLLLPVEPKRNSSIWGIGEGIDYTELFGTGGESGLASERALSMDGQCNEKGECWLVCLVYANAGVPEDVDTLLQTSFRLTYLNGVDVLHDGEGINVGFVKGLGDFYVESDMTLSADERIKIQCMQEGEVRTPVEDGILQGAIVVPLTFKEGVPTDGTLYTEFSVRGLGAGNEIIDEKDTYRLNGAAAETTVEIGSFSVKYLFEDAYKNGSYSNDALSDQASFINSGSCYAVVDFTMTALQDNDGTHTISLLTSVPQRGTMSATIEEAPTGKIEESLVNGDTKIYAVFSIPPKAGESKSLRMLIRLLPISGGTVELDVFAVGDVRTALTGSTYFNAKLNTGDPTLEYTLSSDGKYYTVTKILNESLTAVTIPDKMPDGLPITGFAADAFKGNKAVKSIVIGNHVQSIPAQAFKDCTSLREITIGRDVTSVGANSFVGCTALQVIYYNAVFCGDGSLGIQATGKFSVTIGKDVKRIPANMLANTSLLRVTFENGSVCETIGERAFYGCKSLQSVSIPSGSIGEFAFCGCESLESVSITSSGSVGKGAFSECKGLLSANISCGGDIGEGAFSGCTALTEITVGENVARILDRAFYNCTALTSFRYLARDAKTINRFLYLGGNDSDILVNAGQNGEGITVTIGAQVKCIPSMLFHSVYGDRNENAPKIVSVVFEEGSVCTTISAEAFYGCTVTHINLPDSLTTIGSNAFYGSSLISVTIPDGVKKIEDSTFSNCHDLTEVIVGSGVERIQREAFYCCDALKTLHYTGKIADWNSIQKETYWNAATALSHIVCSDGTITL